MTAIGNEGLVLKLRLARGEWRAVKEPLLTLLLLDDPQAAWWGIAARVCALILAEDVLGASVHGLLHQNVRGNDPRAEGLVLGWYHTNRPEVAARCLADLAGHLLRTRGGTLEHGEVVALLDRYLPPA